MAWLAKLDARATRWPRPAFWGYTVIKYGLAALGAAALLSSWSEKSSDIASWF